MSQVSDQRMSPLIASYIEEMRHANLTGAMVDQVVFAVRPLSASADIHGGLTWRELS